MKKQISNRNILLVSLLAFAMLAGLVYYIFIGRNDISLADYSNDEFGIAFKYPEGWSVNESVSRGETESLTVFVDSDDSGSATFEFGVAKFEEEISYDEVKKTYESAGYNVEETEIDGSRAFKVSDSEEKESIAVYVFGDDGKVAITTYTVAGDVDDDGNPVHIKEFDASYGTIDLY